MDCNGSSLQLSLSPQFYDLITISISVGSTLIQGEVCSWQDNCCLFHLSVSSSSLLAAHFGDWGKMQVWSHSSWAVIIITTSTGWLNILIHRKAIKAWNPFVESYKCDTVFTVGLSGPAGTSCEQNMSSPLSLWQTNYREKIPFICSHVPECNICILPATEENVCTFVDYQKSSVVFICLFFFT